MSRRRIGRVRIVAALAVLGLMISADSAARAGGIVITSGTSEPVGDPFYQYTFDFQLLPLTTLDYGGYVTVKDLPEIDMSSLVKSPSSFWGSSITADASDPGFYDVTWYWRGATSNVNNSSTDNKDLGWFSVGPTSMPHAPNVSYVSSLDGKTISNTGSVQVNIVPEPSGTVLMLTAAVTVGLIAGRRGRRRRR